MSFDVIDISCPLRSGMPVYPGDPPVRIDSFVADGFRIGSISLGTHAATHIDFPRHMLFDRDEGGAERFVLPAILHDARGQDIVQPTKELEARITRGCAVIIKACGKNPFDAEDCFGKHRIISVELAELLVKKEVAMLGVDLPSPDFEPYPVHRLLLSSGIPILEGLYLEKLCAESFTLLALPLLSGTDASPVRAMALCEH